MAKIIPALWFSIVCLLVCGGLNVSAAPARRKPVPKRAAPKAADLASMVRAWRAAPTPKLRAAVETYAAKHAKDSGGVLANLALGVGSYEQRDYAATVAALRKAQPKAPRIADYAAYYLAAARLEMNDTAGLARELAPAHTAVSPISGRAWLIEARALKPTAPVDAARLLRDHYAELPQPEGDVTLADCYLAANNLPQAVEFYQRVYFQFLTGAAATRSAAALEALKASMGAAYPQPLPQQMLRRADRFLEIRDYSAARAEYESLLSQAPDLEREQARVRMGAADLGGGHISAARAYLRGLQLSQPEAEAERVYDLEECARNLSDDSDMMFSLRLLGEQHPKSPWRLKGLILAANRYLLVNRPEEYAPLYRAAYQEFPNEPVAALCHWKVTFEAWLHRKPGAKELLREHLRNYCGHATTGAALYFLGRGAEQEGDAGSARAFYSSLSKNLPNTYYAMSARARLSRNEIAKAAPSEFSGQLLGALKWPAPRPVPDQPSPATSSRIERSRLLRAAGLNDLADSELRFGARTDGQPELLGMEMAGVADTIHQGLRIMKSMAPDYLNLPIEAAPRKFWELLFPLPYRDELMLSAKRKGVDPFLLAGLVRQESEFNPEAVSRANAFGLTQVRPGTGRQFARAAGVPRFANRLLLQPGTNLQIGASILRSMLDQNGGSLERTLASYNAGPNRVAEWTSWNTFNEPAEFIESIPFTETRDYVQAVLRNAEIYRRLYQ